MGMIPPPGAFARPELVGFQVNDVEPFMTGADIQDQANRGAHAMLLWLAAGLRDAHAIDIVKGRGEADMSATTAGLMAASLEGVSMLVALSAYGTEVLNAERLHETAK